MAVLRYFCPVQGSIHILLVDDDSDDQFLFGEALNEIQSPAILHTAQDGVDALEKLEGGKLAPDIIFLDLNMPRMNGRKFLEMVKSNPSFSNIPVIIYSTSSSPEDKKATEAGGAKAFITKPTNFDDLCSLLSNTIQKDF